jgi:hypothetical protein
MVGSSHSFSPIAEAHGVQLDVGALRGLIHADPTTARVRLGAGTPLHALPEILDPLGLALENMGDIDRQTIAGAISTGTHGTGVTFGGIASRVVGATIVTADGEVLTVEDDDAILPAVQLGLGALGVLVDVTLQCVPSFLLRADERPEGFDPVLESFEERVRASNHFEFYWFPHTTTVLTKTNTRLPTGVASAPLSPLTRWVDDSLLSNGLYAATCRLGRAVPVIVPSINRLATRLIGDREFTDRSYRVFATKRAVRFREMEYSVPLAAVPGALREIRALIEARRWRISLPHRGARGGGGCHVAVDLARPRERLHRRASLLPRRPPRVLRGGRVDPSRSRRQAALGQDPHAGCRIPRAAVPPLRRLHGGARSARPFAHLHQRLHPPRPGAVAQHFPIRAPVTGRYSCAMELLIIFGILVALVVVVGIYLWATYNGLVTLNVRVDEAWSDITVQLKRRADLLPNLIETVKGYAAHERGVFEAVTKARAESLSAGSPAEAAVAENHMQSALKSIFAVAEAYPQLQASQNYLQLQGELVDTEDKIQAARRFYNGGVRELNTKIKVFPNTLFVRGLGFNEREFFEVSDAAAIAEPPRVQF